MLTVTELLIDGQAHPASGGAMTVRENPFNGEIAGTTAAEAAFPV